MGYQDLLELVTRHLSSVGLRAGEEYPAGKRMEVLSPVTAVGLEELDATAGTARFSIRVLSPRLLGSWCCQVWAARAADMLTRVGMTCTAEEMDFLSGSDCFCVKLTAVMSVVYGSSGWTVGKRWQVFCGETEQTGVESFRADRDQGRRLVGAHGQSSAVGVSPGNGGWTLELVQWVDRMPEEVSEPFTLTVRERGRQVQYTGCCWNQERTEYTQRGTRLTRRGFALGREETING